MMRWKALTGSAIKEADTGSQRRCKFRLMIAECIPRGNIAWNWPNEDRETGPSTLFAWPELVQLLVLWTGEDNIAESEICCADAMVRGLTDLFDSVTFEERQSVFQNWIERLKSIIRHNGECFIKWLIKVLLVLSSSRNGRGPLLFAPIYKYKHKCKYKWFNSLQSWFWFNLDWWKWFTFRKTRGTTIGCKKSPDPPGLFP
jgi:hypothetical protein